LDIRARVIKHPGFDVGQNASVIKSPFWGFLHSQISKPDITDLINCCKPGLPDFSCYTYIPNLEKMYQMNTKCTKQSHKISPNVCKIVQMALKYLNMFQSKALQNLPKLEFLFENKPSGNPAANCHTHFQQRYKFR
jgi:hypothetical protein